MNVQVSVRVILPENTERHQVFCEGLTVDSGVRLVSTHERHQKRVRIDSEELSCLLTIYVRGRLENAPINRVWNIFRVNARIIHLTQPKRGHRNRSHIRAQQPFPHNRRQRLMIQRNPRKNRQIINHRCIVIHPHIKQGEQGVLLVRVLCPVMVMPLSQHIIRIRFEPPRVMSNFPVRRFQLVNAALQTIVRKVRNLQPVTHHPGQQVLSLHPVTSLRCHRVRCERNNTVKFFVG